MEQLETARSSLSTLQEEVATLPRGFSGDSALGGAQKESTTAGVSVEQVLPLYLQLTNKRLDQLTPLDVQAIEQLAANPQLIFPQLPSAPLPVTQQLTAEEQALLDAYTLPSTAQPSNQEQFNRPFSCITEEETLLEAYQAPVPSEQQQLDCGFQISPEEQALLDACQQPVEQTSDNQFQLSPEELELLNTYQQPSKQHSATGFRLSPEDQALLDAYQQPTEQPSATGFQLSPEELERLNTHQQPTEQHSATGFQFSPEDQALLEAYQAPVGPSAASGFQISPEEQALLDAYQAPQNPFGNLSPEELAILQGEDRSESPSSSEDVTQSSSSTSATEEEIMEPPRETVGFSAGSSSFYTAEVHPSVVMSRRASESKRSSGVRSSFAEEQRRVRPSMEIAGGQFTRPSSVQASRRPSAVRSTDRRSVASKRSGESDASSHITVQELPPELPRTAIPPMAPPPPPSEPPSTLIGLSPAIQEMEAMTFSMTEAAAPVHQRMERLNIIRSSFAAERQSLEERQSIMATGMFGGIPDTGKITITTDSLASELERRYEQLAVVPDDVPFPLTLLCLLWGILQPLSLKDAEAAAALMEAKKIIRLATLEDGSLWCMMNSEHTKRLKQQMSPHLSEMHSRLINLYRQGFQDLALVPDDNYFMQNVAYHLVGAGRLTELAGLLRDAIWLETKLRSYGTGPVVADFRRFFTHREDPDLNLMLRAFQISANGSLDHSTLYVLKEQMLGRLMVSAQVNPGIKEWYDQGTKEWRMAVPYRKSRSMPVHLLPKTPALEQAGGLQRLILKGHTDSIHKVQLAPNGLEVVTASADGTVRVWDMEIGDFVLKMEDHDGPVCCFALSKDGGMLISGGEDGVAIVYDLPSGIWRHKLCGHTKRVNAVAIDPNCQRAVTSSQDMTTRIWSLSQGTCLNVLSEAAGARGRTWEEWAGHHDMVISPDARIIATVDADFRVRIWNMESASMSETLEGHSDWVVSLAFAGDSGSLVTASHDKTLRLWDLWNGICEHVFTGHRGRINNLKVTEDGRRAVSVSDDAIGIVWNLKEHAKVCQLEGHSAWINDAAITQDGLRVATVAADELCIVWDGNTGEALRILKGHSGEINGISLSYKGRFAITASTDQTARVWDLSAPMTHLEDYHHGRVTQILYHPGYSKVVTIGDDRTILIWDVTTCKCTHLIRSLSNINFAFLVAEGTQLITASGDRSVCVWDMTSGESVRKLPPHTGSRLKSISVSSDGTHALIVLFDSTITLWNLETMELVQWLMRRAERDGIAVHSAAVNSVVMPKEPNRALTVSKDHTARLWDLTSNSTTLILTGTPLQQPTPQNHPLYVTGHEDGVNLVSVKEDCSICMTAGYDRSARLWDLKTGECTMVLDHPKDIDFLAVDSQWRRAVTIAGEDTAWLWDISKGRCLGILESQGDQLCGAVFSPDGRFLATYSTNSVLRIWTATSGKLRAVYLADTSISSCHFAGVPEMDTIIVGDGNGHVHFLEFPANELASVRHKKHRE